MTKHFNNLSEAQLERLAILVEECAEVQQIAMKIMRHGYLSYNPDDPDETENSQLLNKELGDLQLILDLMAKEEDIDEFTILGYRDAKKRKIHKYLHHQTHPKYV